MGKKIEVGILGRHRHGGPALRPAPGGPPVVRAQLARRQRSQRRQDATARPPPGSSRARRRRTSAERVVEECVPGRGPRLVFSSMSRQPGRRDRARLRRRRPHRGLQLQPLPDGAGRPPAGAGDQSRSPGPAGGAAAGAGLGGAIVTNPNCAAVVLVMAARAAQALRHPQGRGHHLPGGLRRRLPRRAVARHPRQRHPLHRRRGAEGGERAAEDPRRPRRGPTSSRSPLHGERELQPGAVDRRPPGLVSLEFDRRPDARRSWRPSRGFSRRCPRSASCPSAPSGRSISWRRRTARRRARTPASSAAWRPPSAGCASAPLPLEVRGALAQRPARRRRRRPAQRRADEERGAARAR